MFRAFPSLNSRQLTEAMIYESIDPWGEWRNDLRTGIVASTIANAMSTEKTTTFTPADFMPTFQKQEIEETEPTEIEIAEKIKGAFEAIRQAMSNGG